MGPDMFGNIFSFAMDSHISFNMKCLILFSMFNVLTPTEVGLSKGIKGILRTRNGLHFEWVMYNSDGWFMLQPTAGKAAEVVDLWIFGCRHIALCMHCAYFIFVPVCLSARGLPERAHIWFYPYGGEPREDNISETNCDFCGTSFSLHQGLKTYICLPVRPSDNAMYGGEGMWKPSPWFIIEATK